MSYDKYKVTAEGTLQVMNYTAKEIKEDVALTMRGAGLQNIKIKVQRIK